MSLNMNLCRACLVTKETFSYFLFDNVSVDIFVFCTSIQACENELLPHSLCNNCYELLEKFYHFKNTCLQSQKTLLSLQHSIKSEKVDTFAEVFKNGLQNGNIKEEGAIGRDKDSNNDVDNGDNDFNEDVAEEDNEYNDEVPMENTLQYVSNRSKKKIKIKKGKIKISKKKEIPKIKRPAKKLCCQICSKRFKHEYSFEAHKLMCEGKVACENELLPHSLCNNCYELLEKFYHFKNTCLQSQKTLLSLQHSIKSEKVDTFAEVFKNGLQNGNIKEEGAIGRDKDSNNDVDNGDNDFNEDVAEEDNEYNDEVPMENTLQYVSNRSKKKIKIKKGKIKISKKKEIPKIKRPAKKLCCQICSKRFKHEYSFEAHKLMCEGKVSGIVCPKCSKPFSTWSNFHRHVTDEHINVKLGSLKCQTCGKVCKTQTTLKNHVKLHEGGNKELYVCDVCGKNLANGNVLKKHLEIHNANRERAYSCEHCDKKFLSRSTLRIHIVCAHEGRRFICHVCSYPFTNRASLTSHLLLHQGVKNYKCDICDKLFSKSGTLVIHKRTHSGERPFSCSYCQKCFISTSRLQAHIRTHTGERPYVCKVCSQSYTQPVALKRHMKIHNKVLV